MYLRMHNYKLLLNSACFPILDPISNLFVIITLLLCYLNVDSRSLNMHEFYLVTYIVLLQTRSLCVSVCVISVKRAHECDKVLVEPRDWNQGLIHSHSTLAFEAWLSLKSSVQSSHQVNMLQVSTSSASLCWGCQLLHLVQHLFDCWGYKLRWQY